MIGLGFLNEGFGRKGPMEAHPSKDQKDGELVSTDFPKSPKSLKFKKESLVEELLSLGNPKITTQIARLVGDEVEKEIHARRLALITSEVVSELVAQKLGELGLIKGKNVAKIPYLHTARGDHLPPARDDLHEEVLELLSPALSQTKNQGLRGALSSSQIKYRQLDWTDDALDVLKQRYGLRDKHHVYLEEGKDILNRVARFAAQIEASDSLGVEGWEGRFFNLMASREFIPSSLIFRNTASTKGLFVSPLHIQIGQGPARTSRVLSLLLDAYEKGAQAILTFEGGDKASSCAPHEFMNFLEQGLILEHNISFISRETWAVVSLDHPGILNFFESILQNESPTYEVGFIVPDGLLEKIRQSETLSFSSTQAGGSSIKMNARSFFKKWLHVLDHLENPRVEFKPVNRTSFVEGSLGGTINLSTLVEKKKIDWERFKEVIHSSIRFLDNIYEQDAYRYPASNIQDARQISLSLMGWAQLLEDLGIPYNSDNALELAHEISHFLKEQSQEASRLLGQQRGIYQGASDDGFLRRHKMLLAINPTSEQAYLGKTSAGLAPIGPEADTSDPDAYLRTLKVFQANLDGRVHLPIPINIEGRLQKMAKIILIADEEEIPVLDFKLIGKVKERFHFPTISNQKIVRPKLLKGVTHRLRSLCGTCFVTLNVGDNKIYEVLLTPERESQCQASSLKAIALMISQLCRLGMPLEDIIRLLDQSPCEEHGGEHGLMPTLASYLDEWRIQQIKAKKPATEESPVPDTYFSKDLQTS